jgi:hypothetical protein
MTPIRDAASFDCCKKNEGVATTPSVLFCKKEFPMARPASFAFQPQEHLVQLEDGPYLPVQWRLAWFHQATGPRAGYVTIEMVHDRKNGFAQFLTIAWDGQGESWRQVKLQGVEFTVCGKVATGEGSEEASHFPDYYEAAATKSLGRALEGLVLLVGFCGKKRRNMVLKVLRQHLLHKAHLSRHRPQTRNGLLSKKYGRLP